MAVEVIWGTKDFQVPEYFNFAAVIDEWAQKEKVTILTILSANSAHFAVVCLAIWPLSGSEATVDFCCDTNVKIVLFFTSNKFQFMIIHMQKASRFVTKRQLQPHFHSKARALSTQL